MAILVCPKSRKKNYEYKRVNILLKAISFLYLKKQILAVNNYVVLRQKGQ